MKKLLLALLLAALLLCFGTAQARTQTWKLDEDAITTMQVTSFEEDFPGALRQTLDAAGYAEYSSYRGAMIERIAKDAEDKANESATALVAVEQEGRRLLLSVDIMEAEVTNLGEKFLLADRAFSISVADRSEAGSRAFTITYPRADGGQECYGLWWGMVQWNMEYYTSQDASGNGIVISSTYPEYGFRVTQLPWTGGGDVRWDERGTFYPAYLPLWLAYMDGIADYPTTEEEAIREAAESWKRFEGTDLAMLLGPNLRTRPTGSSETLGEYNAGTLVHVLGQEPGKDAPWYHVRIGHVEGYASGRYVHFPKTEDFSTTMWHLPMPQASADSACILRQAPDANSEAVIQIPAGMEMHVLTETNGWLHVMVPKSDIGWEMDVDGASGYVRAAEVTLL